MAPDTRVVAIMKVILWTGIGVVLVLGAWFTWMVYEATR